MILRFSPVVCESTSSALSPDEDLCKIRQWAYKWKMLFNPDASRQAQKIVFSCRKILLAISDIQFDNVIKKEQRYYLSILTNGIKLDPNTRALDFHAMFSKKLPTFMTPKKNICNIFDPQGFKLLNSLILCFSHLRRQSFDITLQIL